MNRSARSRRETPWTPCNDGRRGVLKGLGDREASTSSLSNVCSATDGGRCVGLEKPSVLHELIVGIAKSARRGCPRPHRGAGRWRC